MLQSRALFPLIVAASTLVGLLPQAGSAGEPKADAKKQCVAAYSDAQRLRRDGKLRQAREQLIVCAQTSCPTTLRNECVPWLSEVEASIPSVVIEARDEKGKETSAVRVVVDGVVLSEKAEGRSIDVDPGEHTFRFEHGDLSLEDKMVIREGEKNRKVPVDFSKLAAAAKASAAPTASAPPPAPTETAESSTKPPILAYALGGVGVVGLGCFAIFGLSGKSKENDLTSNCAPNCEQSDVSSMRTRYLIADISLGVGVVSLGVATYLFLSRPKEKPASSSAWLDVSPAPGGGQLTLRGGF